MEPISREVLQNLKINFDEEYRVKQINTIVTQIYTKVIHHAKTTPSTSYNFPVPQVQFNPANMPDILAKLQELFPDCSISHTLMAKGTDGKMYDIAKLDDKILPFVNKALNNSYIIVDWS